MPWCDTDAMASHLIEISAAVDPGAHAVLIVDQAGWHLTPKLAIPDNISPGAGATIARVEPGGECRQFMRDNFVERIFKSYEDIARCAAKPVIDQPWKIFPRHAQMGAWVLINDRWYNTLATNIRSIPKVMAMQMRRQRRLAALGTQRGEIESPFRHMALQVSLTPGNHGAIRRALYGHDFAGKRLVEPRGIEPLTFALRTRRSPN